MSIKHVATIICENVIVGQDDKFSLINVTNNVLVPSIPGGLHRLFVVAMLSGKDGDVFEVSIAGPDGADLPVPAPVPYPPAIRALIRKGSERSRTASLRSRPRGFTSRACIPWS